LIHPARSELLSLLACTTYPLNVLCCVQMKQPEKLSG
jgi:hypothetical protein